MQQVVDGDAVQHAAGITLAIGAHQDDGLCADVRRILLCAGHQCTQVQCGQICIAIKLKLVQHRFIAQHSGEETQTLGTVFLLNQQ